LAVVGSDGQEECSYMNCAHGNPEEAHVVHFTGCNLRVVEASGSALKGAGARLQGYAAGRAASQ